uniref:Argonaute 4 n=1 Tax=Chenopodium quinoa TaxID=63459 RepID=A0A803LZQ5_CHEQI
MDAPEQKQVRVSMARPGCGSKGQKIRLLTNHFNVKIANTEGFFFHYSVALYYEDGKPVEMKGVGRKVMDKIKETYSSEMGGKEFAYDGEKTLFTVGSLPRKKLEFTVLLDKVSSERTDGKSSPGGNGSPNESDKKRRKRVSQSKTFKVEISYATRIPIKAISDALRGIESEDFLDAVRVLDIVLRQHAANQGCLLVRQSFFRDDRNSDVLGGGVLGCRGHHSSFRATQSGLSLNMDGTLTTIVQPGPLIDFLLANQNVQDPYQLDWVKAKRTLKNLRIRVEPANIEWKICGLSEEICKRQKFTLRRRSAERGGENFEEIELTVYEYFAQQRNIKLRYSGDFPCVNVGKPKRPTYIPVELCSLLPLQRYTKALTVQQRSSLVEKSRQKPQDKIRTLTDAMRRSNYAAEPLLRTCGITINNEFMQVEGRVLAAPKLKFGDGEDFPRNGRWNVNRKRFSDPVKIKNWVVVNFSARCDIRNLCRDLVKFGRMKDIEFTDSPMCTFEEDPQYRRAPPPVRVDKMASQVKSRLPGPSTIILCVFADRKNSEIYGPWKKKALVELGVVSQCLAPQRVNEQYLTNLLLKINAKLGGLNHRLAVERNIPVLIDKPMIILGMDVSHGSPGQSGVPSIAAVVSSRPTSIYKYRASVRSQSPKVEMIDSLYKPLPGGKDGGIIRELLEEYYSSSDRPVKPSQVIIFRDGVSESQFKQVLNIEFEQILQACKALDESWSPKFTIIIAQKNHHTKFFEQGSPNNVPPGTVVDSKVCHPLYYDFYMCAQAGMIGTSRPTHYHVLLDEIGFSADQLQELIHSLSYVYQRSTTAISIAAPIRYAHLEATQVSQFLKYEDLSETSSGHGSMTSVGNPSVPEIPKLHDR